MSALPTPFGCAVCGTAQHHHGLQWSKTVGLHQWQRPADAQVKERMLARRAARVSAENPTPAPLPHEDESLPPQLREALRIMSRRGPVVELTAPTGAQAPTPLSPEREAEIDARVEDPHLTAGPWRLEYESCDCGGDYPCSHGSYPSAVVTKDPTPWAVERAKRTGEAPRDYDFHRSEMPDFTHADWELMAHAREDVPALLAEVKRLRTRVAELEQHAAAARTETIADVGDWLDEIGQKDAAYLVYTCDIPAARDMKVVPQTTEDGAR